MKFSFLYGLYYHMAVIKISSPQNPVIKDALKVRAGKKKGFYLIEGPHLLEMALSQGIEIKEVFFTEDFAKRYKELLKGLLKSYEITPTILKRLSETKTPQGVVAVVEIHKKTLKELALKNNPLLVAIDGVSEPGNMGSIIRVSDASGSGGVIVLRGSCEPFSPKSIRASQGSVFNIPIVKAEREEFIEWARLFNIKLIATHQRAEPSIYDIDLRGAVALIFGNESHGISKELSEASSAVARIPIIGHAESLNVGHTAAICLYEAVRQRTYGSS